jgi:hypothetical protein
LVERVVSCSAPPSSVSIDDPEVSWCFPGEPVSKPQGMQGFYNDLIGLDQVAARGATKDYVKGIKVLLDRAEIKEVIEEIRNLPGREYILTLEFAGVRDGWVYFEPVASTPVRERLAKCDVVQNDPRFHGFKLQPAILPVFDFSGRDRGDVVLEKLPSYLRREGLPHSRLPTAIFPCDLLQALQGDKQTFQLHLRVVRVNYVTEKQEGAFTALLFSVMLKAIML